MTSILLWGGVIAGPLFVAVFLVEGLLRPNYNPMRQPVSALSQGRRGWVQKLNFLINSFLLLAGSIGLHSILIGIYALGLFGAGVFVTDAGRHPAGSNPTKRSVSGVLHDIFSLAVFVSLCAACFVYAHFFFEAGEMGWHLFSAITGVLYGAGFLVFARGFSSKSNLAPFAGLLQRLTISLGALWLSLVSLHILGLL